MCFTASLARTQPQHLALTFFVMLPQRPRAHAPVVLPDHAAALRLRRHLPASPLAAGRLFLADERRTECGGVLGRVGMIHARRIVKRPNDDNRAARRHSAAVLDGVGQVVAEIRRRFGAAVGEIHRVGAGVHSEVDADRAKFVAG